MSNLTTHPATPSLMQLWRVLRGKAGDKKAYLDDHLPLRKFVLSRCGEHYGFNKHEPAPLLGRQLLDIGCGASHMAQDLTFRGADCTAVDTCPQTIAAAQQDAEREGAMVEFVCCAAEELVRESKQYDIILCMDVLSYTPDPRRLIWSIDKLLKHDGLVIFADTNPTCAAKLWNVFVPERALKWLPRGSLNLKKAPPLKTVESLFKSFGFHIDKMTGFAYDFDRNIWFKTTDTRLRYMAIAYKTSPSQIKAKPLGL